MQLLPHQGALVPLLLRFIRCGMWCMSQYYDRHVAKILARCTGFFSAGIGDTFPLGKERRLPAWCCPYESLRLVSCNAAKALGEGRVGREPPEQQPILLRRRRRP